MKRTLFFLAMVFLFGVNPAFATDCRIVSIERISGTGILDNYRITFDLSSIRTIERTAPIFHGQKAPNDEWVLYDGVSYIGDSRIAVVDILNWPSGEYIEFSTGAMYGKIIWYTSPDCAEEEPSEYAFSGHYRVKLGEKKKNRVPTEAISLLFLKSNKPVVHKCPVVSVKRILAEGDLGDYEITLSLQKFLGAPLEAVPYMDHQKAPFGVWTGFYPISRKEDVAIAVIKKWPIGSPIEFSYKLVYGGENFWQDLASWDTECLQIYEGHLRLTLE